MISASPPERLANRYVYVDDVLSKSWRNIIGSLRV
jgi:hypothetical protein